MIVRALPAMTMRHAARHTLLRLTPLFTAACSVGPAWTEPERVELAAMQQAVLAACAAGDAALLQNAMATLPEGKDLGDLDIFLHVFPSIADDGSEGYREAWSIGRGHLLPGMLFHGERQKMLAVAGHAIAGFDALHDFTVDPVRGAVLLAARRGEQTVATAQGVWTGSLWHRSFRPELSSDGSHFAYVENNWFRDRVMLAPTDAPERGVPIELPGVVQWPLWLGRDGTRVRCLVAVDGRVEVRDGDRVVATADGFAHAYLDAEHDELRVHLTTAGKMRLLFGDRLSPPLDSYRWIDESRGGKHYLAAGREGDLECVVFDGEIVLRHRKLAWMELSDDGSAWACAVQEGEQCFVVTPNSRSGPFPLITQLVLAPDGSSLAMCTREGRKWSWTLDGQPLGASYQDLRDVVLLAKRGGALFSAVDAQGWWIVTPDGKDGPWDRVERLHLRGGKYAVALALRGREAHRRVLPLP